jgi:hypothetical protein
MGPERTGIVRILLLSDSLDGAIEGREHPTPDTKVTTEDGGARLDGCDGTYPSLPVRAVSEAFDTVPDGTTDGLRRRKPVSHDITIEGIGEGEGEHTPIQKAPPKSDKATQGQGSRE